MLYQIDDHSFYYLNLLMIGKYGKVALYLFYLEMNIQLILYNHEDLINNQINLKNINYLRFS